MNSRTKLNQKRARRTIRVRARIFGAAKRPRLAVFRSNTYFYAQLINDEKGNTLAFVTSRGMDKKGTKSEQAATLGEMMAKKAIELGVKQAVFDRRGYAYHGRVKAFAESARKGGLQF